LRWALTASGAMQKVKRIAVSTIGDSWFFAHKPLFITLSRPNLLEILMLF
jgi:hypothetical protein